MRSAGLVVSVMEMPFLRRNVYSYADTAAAANGTLPVKPTENDMLEW